MPRSPSPERAPDSRQAVEAAVRKVKRAYGRGKEMWRSHPERIPSGWFDKEARRTGIHRCTLRRARQIADPKTGLTKKELNELFAASRKHRHALRPTVLYRLLVLTDRRERFRFLRAAILGGWTDIQTRLELLQMRGRSIAAGAERKMRKGRAGAGKPPVVAATVEELLAQVFKMSTHWTRWFVRLTEEQEPGEPTRHAALADLPAATQKALKRITKAMQDLNTMANRQLRR